MSIGPTASPDASAARPRRRGLKFALAGLLVVVLAIGAARVAPLFVDGDEYAAVASIEQEPTFRDPALMRTAWRLPVAARYDAGQFEYQSNPSFCGPASVSNVVRSLGTATTQQQVVDGTEHDSWFGVLPGGLTLDQVAELLRVRTARPVTVLRGTDLDGFREHMRRSNDPARRYVVNFHRGPLFARGHGHFSPVLGYLEAEDLVLVGDTNREYRPFLVRTERLWQGTRTVDDATGQQRGLLMVEVESPPK